MGDLSKIPNIGKDTEEKLLQAGIDSYEKLAELGSEQVFIRLQTIDPGACINLLYGIDGAIEGIKWNQLSPQRKKQLIDFYKRVKK
jgi:DNA transformation protein and related proteins